MAANSVAHPPACVCGPLCSLAEPALVDRSCRCLLRIRMVILTALGQCVVDLARRSVGFSRGPDFWRFVGSILVSPAFRFWHIPMSNHQVTEPPTLQPHAIITTSSVSVGVMGDPSLPGVSGARHA
jgi:hypothetical protein